METLLKILSAKTDPPIGTDAHFLGVFRMLTDPRLWRVIATWCLFAACVTSLEGCRSKLNATGFSPSNHQTTEASAPADSAKEKLYPKIEIESLSLLGAKPGEVVEIVGRNFRQGMKAVISDSVVNLTITDTTKASFEMPSGAGVGTIELVFEVDATRIGTFSLISDGAGDGLPILLVEPEFICQSMTFRNAKGEIKTGLRDCDKGSLADCTEDGQTNCRANDAVKGAKLTNFSSSDIRSGVQIAGIAGSLDLANLSPANIKRGVQIAGVAGSFPSTSAPLPRYVDSGASLATQPDGAITTDFTNFSTQITSSGAFEFWDSSGVRRTGSGDADIIATNIKAGVTFENLSLIGAAAPPNWDLRAGVTFGSVTGKLKVNCRNSINSTLYNYDGPVGSIPSTSVNTGFDYDVWDTIDDSLGQPPSTGFLSAWSVPNNYCGGVDDAQPQNDDKIWKDVTTGGCNATKCRFKDKISGLEWSKTIQTGRTWPQAVNDCETLTHDGVGGWRLPTQKEAMAAYEHGVASAASANWITSVQMQNYIWTSSSISNSTASAWVVIFSFGYTYDNGKSGSSTVVCVR